MKIFLLFLHKRLFQRISYQRSWGVRHVSVNMFGFLTPRTRKVIYNKLKVPSETLKTLSPDSWKCSCRKCSFLTSWWWSCSPEAKHFHHLIEDKFVEIFRILFFQINEEEHQKSTHHLQQPESTHFSQEKILQECVNSSGWEMWIRRLYS